MTLTAKQEAFCNEYLIDLNATQAAIRAGYSPNTAQEQSSQNLSKLIIADRIAELMKLRSERTRISADRVLTELAKLGFCDIREYFVGESGLKSVSELDDDAAAALQMVKVRRSRSGETDEDGRPIVDEVVEIKLADKRAALELLGKHLGLFTDRLKIENNPLEHLSHDELTQMLVETLPEHMKQILKEQLQD